MSTVYRLIVSTNSQLWGAQVMKDLNNSHFLLSPRWPLWRGLNVFKFKYLGRLKALLNLQFLILSLQAEENTKD